MDTNRAIEVLDYMESECVKRGARKDVEREAIQVAKAALKAQGEPVWWLLEVDMGWPEPLLRITRSEAEAIAIHESYPAGTLATVTPLYTAPQPESQAVPDGWQPIESAPKSTRSILVHCAEYGNTYVVTWREDVEESGWLHFGGCFDRLTETPTHWMPLPAAPAPGGE